MSIYKLSAYGKSFGKAIANTGHHSRSYIAALGSNLRSNTSSHPLDLSCTRSFSVSRACLDLPDKFNEANVISDGLQAPGQNSFGFIADSPLTRLAESFLIDLHDVACLEWSGTIFVAALLFRASVCFPIKVYQERLMARLLNVQPKINELIKKNQTLSKEPVTLAKQKSIFNQRVFAL